MRQYAVIVAGGSGTRMGSSVPKQFHPLEKRPVLWWSMKAFHEENPETELIIVLPEDYIPLWEELFTSLPENEQFDHSVAIGGTTRTDSVINGLKLIADEESLVAIHDGARPLVTKDTIREGWQKAQESGAAIPVVAVTDSLRRLEDDGSSKAVDRSQYVAVQTPQVFKTSLLKKAYQNIGKHVFTDDASVVEFSGYKVHLFPGDHNNIKITNPKDLAIAGVLMRKDA